MDRQTDGIAVATTALAMRRAVKITLEKAYNRTVKVTSLQGAVQLVST